MQSTAQPAGGCPARRPPGAGAFTLVELMVVISILILLATLLIPSLLAVVQETKTVSCLAQLFSISKAMENYSGNNRGFVPRNCEATAPHVLFAAKFLPYVGGPPIPLEEDLNWDYVYDKLSETDIFRCPAVSNEDYVLTYATNAVPFGDFADTNTYPAVGTDAEAASQLGRLPGPASEVAYIVEANLGIMDIKEFPKYDVWHSDQMTFNGDSKMESAHSIKGGDGRHQGSTTVLFFDGTARRRTLKPETFGVRLFNPLDTRWDY